MRTRIESSEVLYAADAVVTIDAAGVAQLKRDGEQNARRRIRLCAHRSIDDPVHEMLIVHTNDTYVRPHKHLSKSESFHVVEGAVDVVIFDDGGSVTDVIEMASFHSGHPFFYRIADPLFHTLLIRSPILVFHETTTGPFRREDTVLAPWAPMDSDSEAIGLFLSDLRQTVASRLSGRSATE